MAMVWVLLGVTLSVAVLVDVWLTILHPDAEGPVAGGVRRLVWSGASHVAGRGRRPRRTPLVLAGPLLVTLTFLVWIVILVVGVALMVWPYLDGYRTADGTTARTFTDAVYYAGGTLTVLGYGDITPGTAASKVLGVAVSAVGFAMFTVLVTYLIQLITGLTVRNRFALAMHDQFRETDAVGLLTRSLVEEGPDAIRRRCGEWADSLRAIEDTVRRFPLVALTYRPRRSDYDLEPALEHLADAAVVALLASRRPALRSLGLRAEELARSLLRTQETIAHHYLDGGRDDGEYLEEQAAEHLSALQARLEIALGPDGRSDGGVDEVAQEVLVRSVSFLRVLRGWAAPGVQLRGTRG